MFTHFSIISIFVISTSSVNISALETITDYLYLMIYCATLYFFGFELWDRCTTIKAVTDPYEFPQSLTQLDEHSTATPAFLSIVETSQTTRRTKASNVLGRTLAFASSSSIPSVIPVFTPKLGAWCMSQNGCYCRATVWQ